MTIIDCVQATENPRRALRSTRAVFPPMVTALMKNDAITSAVVDGLQVYPIPGWEGIYGITKCGKVFRHAAVASCKRMGTPITRQMPPRWLTVTNDSRGYPQVVFKDGKKRRVHRLMGSTFLNLPAHLEVDHVNGVRDDNSIRNLRVANRRQNACNRRLLLKNNTSGHRGVSWHKRAGKWMSSINHKGKTTYLGLFTSIESASKAYDNAAFEMHGNFASPNTDRA